MWYSSVSQSRISRSICSQSRISRSICSRLRILRQHLKFIIPLPISSVFDELWTSWFNLWSWQNCLNILQSHPGHSKYCLSTICTAQFQLCQDIVLATTIPVCCKDFIAIAARWIILWQNEFNRKRTAYRVRWFARALIARAAIARTRRPRQQDWSRDGACNRLWKHVIASKISCNSCFNIM